LTQSEVLVPDRPSKGNAFVFGPHGIVNRPERSESVGDERRYYVADKAKRAAYQVRHGKNPQSGGANFAHPCFGIRGISRIGRRTFRSPIVKPKGGNQAQIRPTLAPKFAVFLVCLFDFDAGRVFFAPDRDDHPVVAWRSSLVADPAVPSDGIESL